MKVSDHLGQLFVANCLRSGSRRRISAPLGSILGGMRIIALLLTLCAPALALADAKKDVEKKVRRELTPALGTDMPADSRILVNGYRTGASSAASEVWDIHGHYSGNPTEKVVKLAVTVDEARGFAWFHALAKLQGIPVRLHGLAKKEAAGWQLAVTSYTWAAADKDLAENAKEVPASKVRQGGDAELAKVGLEWFQNAALAAAAGPKPIANGTAEREYATGAAAVKLAASWDKLKMQPLAVDGWSYGDYGVVRAKVALPIPKKTTSAVLILTAVVVKEAAGWRWVSLNWAGFNDPRGSDYDPARKR